MTLFLAERTQSTEADPEPAARISFPIASLVAEHPPRFRNANKKVIFDLACPPGTAHVGALVASRWRALPLPEVAAGPCPKETAADGIYAYAPPSDPATFAWYVNFADAHLFFAYGGALFAQDEMQVAEHPALASLREALLATEGFPPLTTEEGCPTPVLVMGVPRRCAIATRVDGRSLYGSAMSRATAEVLSRAVTRLDPPTVSHVLAMEALPGGRGPYTRDDIVFVLLTAHTAFAAARIESRRAAREGGGAAARVVVNTGHWGTGAYGGNKVLMALLQILSARLAGIDELVFYTFDRDGEAAYREALRVLDGVCPEAGRPLREVVDRVHALGFEWGVSDGN